MILLAALIFAICCLVHKPIEIEDYTSYLGYAISGVGILFLIYEKFAWRWIPWNRPPVLAKEYRGVIYYSFKRESGTKEIQIHVKQSWLSVSIKTETDINSSISITGTITEEFGSTYLYYTYVTNPKASVQAKNPIQHGTCRLLLDNMDNISGKYWTTSQTIGDIEWRRVN